jgi:hypothetical protein
MYIYVVGILHVCRWLLLFMVQCLNHRIFRSIPFIFSNCFTVSTFIVVLSFIYILPLYSMCIFVFFSLIFVVHLGNSYFCIRVRVYSHYHPWVGGVMYYLQETYKPYIINCDLSRSLLILLFHFLLCLYYSRFVLLFSLVKTWLDPCTSIGSILRFISYVITTL